MNTAIIAVAGSLVGVALGSALSFLAQYALANRTHKWQLEDTKRQSSVEFLTSISVSYANAKAHKGDPEEADLLRATSVIQLVADEEIYKQARLIQVKVTDVHGGIRQAKTKEEKEAAEKPVSDVDNARGKLIELFKADLHIPLDGGQAGSRAWALGHPGTDQPR
jgi:hypothetical protein